MKCRLELIRDGKPYPKSGCSVHGSLFRGSGCPPLTSTVIDFDDAFRLVAETIVGWDPSIALDTVRTPGTRAHELACDVSSAFCARLNKS